MFQISLSVCAKDENIADINDYEFGYKVSKDVIYQRLKSLRGVFQTHGYDQTL